MIAARIKLYLVIALAFSVGSFGVVSHAYGSGSITVSIEATLSYNDGQHPVLKFELRNLSQSSLEMHESNLPWGIQISTRLYAFKLDAMQSQLEEAVYIDDPGPNTIVLQPGEVRYGEISLEGRFPGLHAATKANDIIIFWTYLPISVEFVQGERAGGWVIVPKGTY